MTIAHIVVIVLSATLAFLLLAYAAPRRYQVKIVRRLPAPPDRIWPYLSRPEKFPHWFPYVSGCSTSGEVESGVGQRRRVSLDRKRHLGEREEEVSSWEANRAITLDHLWEHMDGKPTPWANGQCQYLLEPVDGGTRLTGWYTFSGTGTLGRIFSLISFRKKHEKEFKLAFQNLEKRLIEETYPS